MTHSCRTSLIALDIKFRGLHLNNANVLSGTQITAAYLDLTTNKLHLISNGGCRAVVGARRPGIPDVIVELGRPQFSSPRAAVSGANQGGSPTESSTTSAATQHSARIKRAPSDSLSELSQLPAKMASGASLLPAGMTTVQLTEDMESIVLGSTGLWCALTYFILGWDSAFNPPFSCCHMKMWWEGAGGRGGYTQNQSTGFTNQR